MSYFGPPLFLHSEGLRALALCPVCLHLLTSGEHVLCKRADSLVQALHLVLWVGYCPRCFSFAHALEIQQENHEDEI